MSTEDAKDDSSMLLIAKKADYGLAPRKWRASLQQIRALPELQARPAICVAILRGPHARAL
jgi:hypothetical protein